MGSIPSPSPAAPWTLSGRVRPGFVDLPPHPDGAAALDPRCATTTPCFAELWTDGTAVARVSRVGDDLRIDGLPGRATWTAIGSALATCLGDPFAVPPAGDPGALRLYDGTAWTLTFSGDNPCRLGGRLVLDAVHDHADWHGLTVADLPWDTGGQAVLLRKPTNGR